MNIKIKLDNPKYCDGCLFLCDEYKHILLKQNTFCRHFGIELIRGGYWKKVKRPLICIKENGE